MSQSDDELRQKIESLQFTLMTPSPVTVTLGESKLTDEIMQLFIAELQALREKMPEKGHVKQLDPTTVGKENWWQGHNYAVDQVIAALDEVISKYGSEGAR